MWYEIEGAKCDAVLEGAVRYLVDGNELAAARLLLSATIGARIYHDPISTPPSVFTYYVTVFGPRAICDALTNERQSEYTQLLKALGAQGAAVELESVQYSSDAPTSSWRAEMSRAIDRALDDLPGGLPSADRLQASAVRFLIDGGEEDAASVLLSARMTAWPSGSHWNDGDETVYAVHVELEAARPLYEALAPDTPQGGAIRRAIQSVLPSWFHVGHFGVTGALVELDPDWRTELLEIARGKGVHNQGRWAKAPRVWNNLNFRSESEIRVARALDGAGLLFVPNCAARLNSPEGRVNREPDFLVCFDGKWGILEVDGEPFHPPTRTAEDHERDRLFKSHGIRVVEHFDATECYESAGAVVTKFIDILARS